MIVAASPYMLSSRDPAVMASALLAHRVVTLMPSPGAGESLADVRGAAERSPRYAKFMTSWSWAMPMFRCGLFVSMYEGEDPVWDALECAKRVASDPAYEVLQPLSRTRFGGDDADASLDALSGDILKGGVDPGVSVPVSAGLDEFACRHGLVSLRGEASSVAQRAELSCAEREWAVALPCLVRAHGERLIEARAELEPELDAVRSAFAVGRDQVREAAGVYSDAFESASARLTRPDPDEPPVVAGTVTVAMLRSRSGSSLAASVAAASAYVGRNAQGATSVTGEAIRCLQVRPMGGSGRVSGVDRRSAG